MQKSWYRKWLKPIGDEIKTISIDRTKDADNFSIPNTVTQLTERVVRLMPTFMHGYFKYDDDGAIVIKTHSKLADNRVEKGTFATIDIRDELCTNPISVQKENTILKVRVEYEDNIFIADGTEKRFSIYFENKIREQQWFK